MKKNDTLDFCPVVINIDRLYILRFNMDAILRVEKKYGCMRAAIDNLNAPSKKAKIDAAVNILSILTKQNIGAINMLAVMEAFIKIPEALIASYPDPDPEYDFLNGSSQGEEPYEPYDWDGLYYIARYRLKMTDEEFWGTVPRRFFKIYYLWLCDNGFIKARQKLYMGELPR